MAPDGMHITLLVTNICNLSCRYCFSVRNKTSGRDFLLVKKAAQILANFDIPVESISLSGGEPLLHKDITELYLLFASKYRTSITTNGTIVPGDKIMDLKDLSMTVSLNTTIGKVDEAMRGHSCNLGNIMHNIHAVSVNCHILKINTVVSKLNAENLCGVARFLNSLKAHKLKWSLLQMTNNTNINNKIKDLDIDDQEFERIVTETRRQCNEDHIHINGSLSVDLNRRCYMITPEGLLFNMERSTGPLGNILNTKLSKVLHDN